MYIFAINESTIWNGEGTVSETLEELRRDMDSAVEKGNSPEHFVVFKRLNTFTYNPPRSTLIIG